MPPKLPYDLLWVSYVITNVSLPLISISTSINIFILHVNLKNTLNFWYALDIYKLDEIYPNVEKCQVGNDIFLSSIKLLINLNFQLLCMRYWQLKNFPWTLNALT